MLLCYYEYIILISFVVKHLNTDSLLYGLLLYLFIFVLDLQETILQLYYIKFSYLIRFNQIECLYP